ncbi:MAG: hypothetical protein EAZ81_03945 [Verrucomicrobia bacterium]|jgi:hypothetical protein|nr:MAG: hypothetical protein EAZ81_03945 [Verrucomicrobiota bacterium]
MKKLFVLWLMPSVLLAAAPKKPLPGRYAALYTSSPFTTPAPPAINQQAMVNPLDDWALGGVSKFPDGYFVILLNKKRPDEKVIIQPGSASDYEVIEVVDGGQNYTGTQVKLRYRKNMVGIVTFDQKLLSVKSPEQGKVAPASQPSMPPGVQSMQGGLDQGNRGNRIGPQPRLRTIAPPAPGGRNTPIPTQPQR